MFEDLDEVCNAIDRLEGKAPLKDLGHKNDIGRNSVPEAPQPEDAVQTCAPSRPTLSLEAALQLQRELYEGFANKDFQAELRELEEQHGKGYEGYGGEAERTALYLTVQSAILPKYGFEGSQAGVVAMLEAASCHNTNEEFRENRRMLNQLLGLEPTGEELSRRVGAAKGKGKGKGKAAEEEDDDEYEEEDEFGSIGYETDDDEYAEEGEDEERREAKCKARFLPGSPMKFRRVLWQIRGKSYREALMLLEFLPWRHCKPTLKALQSAAANAQNHYNMDKSRLYISMCRAAPGPVMKRMRPVSKGQAHMYKKRTTHLEIRVAEMEDDQLDEID
mmetsp:Transcript_92416/g.287554  ORF Transcript_92416/g.287554 Transcript_92416/m.287554 type:complete len:333 (+) Transcript_92416:79-1077(+)